MFQRVPRVLGIQEMSEKKYNPRVFLGLELDFRILDLENRKIFEFGSQNLLKTAKIQNVTSDSESPRNSRKKRINSILAYDNS